MTYKIELNNRPDYIYVTYSAQANLDARKSLTNDLIQTCKESEIFIIVIDTTNMNHAMSPIDFFAFADAFCSTVSDRKIKVVIVTRKLEKFTVLTRIVMNSTGITNAMFGEKGHAVDWLFKEGNN
ncbi:hypothetical protein [Kaarinaea lacus]